MPGENRCGAKTALIWPPLCCHSFVLAVTIEIMSLSYFEWFMAQKMSGSVSQQSLFLGNINPFKLKLNHPKIIHKLQFSRSRDQQLLCTGLKQFLGTFWFHSNIFKFLRIRIKSGISCQIDNHRQPIRRQEAKRLRIWQFKNSEYT